MKITFNYIVISDNRSVEEYDQITEIQKPSFKDLFLTFNCANITMLDLSHIQDLPKNRFDETTYAGWLSYNQFTNFSQVSPSIEESFFNFNIPFILLMLHKFNHQVPPRNMTGIKVLNISHNQIVDIPKTE